MLSSKNNWRREYDRLRYYQRKAVWIEKLGGECTSCGSRENLEFDHIDSNLKKFTISKLWTKPAIIIEEELQKCRLLCSPCHDKRHSTSVHGMRSKYMLGCRCEKCVKVQREYNKEYRQKRKSIQIL